MPERVQVDVGPRCGCLALLALAPFWLVVWLVLTGTVLEVG